MHLVWCGKTAATRIFRFANWLDCILFDVKLQRHRICTTRHTNTALFQSRKGRNSIRKMAENGSDPQLIIAFSVNCNEQFDFIVA